MEAKPEQPERPWTPSYSVTTQGPASPAEGDAEIASQAFPTTEVAEHGPKVTTKWVSYQNFISTIDRTSMHRPSLARLAPVDEHAQANATSPADLDTLSPTARARHESTTSSQSRVIPGGWVSGAKSSEASRPSTDHAAGEFSKKTPATPSTAAPASTPVESSRRHSHHEKKKSRFCVIM